MIELHVLDENQIPHQWWINFCERNELPRHDTYMFQPTDRDKAAALQSGAKFSFTVTMVNRHIFLNYSLQFSSEEDATLFLLTYS